MAITLHKSRLPKATPSELIADEIAIGAAIRQAVEKSKFYKALRVNGAIGDTIRACNMALGCGASYKNGCLYREAGLAETWAKSNGEAVVCDHAVPIARLVEDHLAGEPIERLMFSPVVRISRESDQMLTQSGYARSGGKEGYPLFRYSLIDMQIVTHKGELIDPATWTNDQNWELVRSTDELNDVLVRFSGSLPVFPS